MRTYQGAAAFAKDMGIDPQVLADLFETYNREAEEVCVRAS